MSALPPAPPPPMPAPLPPGSTGPDLGDTGWSVRPGEPEASPRSQAAVYAAVLLGLGVGSAAIDTGDVTGWTFATALALTAGIAVGLTTDLRRLFAKTPGVLCAIFAVFGSVVLLVVLASLGVTLPFPLTIVAGAFVLGLDWRAVNRLRPLIFVAGIPVVLGVAGEQTWTYPAALIWLAVAFGALTALEADRRAAQPKVEAMTPGPSSPDLRTDDLITTILIALAVALLAALLLSTPSCRNPSSDNRFDSLDTGRSGSAEGYFDPDTGEWVPGTGTGSGTGSSTGSGSAPGSGSGSSGLADHQYVPDPNGQYLIPRDGSATDDLPASPIPIPGGSLTDGQPSGSTFTDGEGTTFTYRVDEDGRSTITVTEPGERTRTYRYRDLANGLTQIQEFDEDGTLQGTWFYDPEGQVAEGGQAGASDPTAPQEDEPQDERPKADDDEKLDVDWRLIVAIAGALLAIAGLAWLYQRYRNRPPPPSAPPWALQLAKRIDDEGKARGRSRRSSEPLVGYSRALADDALPDPRLLDVAAIVSDALFGRAEPSPDSRSWAESTFEQVLAEHPVPTRAERRNAESVST